MIGLPGFWLTDMGDENTSGLPHFPWLTCGFFSAGLFSRQKYSEYFDLTGVDGFVAYINEELAKISVLALDPVISGVSYEAFRGEVRVQSLKSLVEAKAVDYEQLNDHEPMKKKNI